MFIGERIQTCGDARDLARRYLPRMVFDYIDGAAGEEYGERLNRETIRALRLQPRILNNVEHRDLSVSVFGQEMGLPFGICPMGMCNLSRPGADLTLARLAAKRRIPHGVSTAASTSLERINEAAEGRAWFQLYFSGDEAVSLGLVKRAETAGYETLILTVDVPEIGHRPRELRRGFCAPFAIGLAQFLDFVLHPRWSLGALFHGKPKLANFGGDQASFNRHASRAGADWSLLDRLRAAWKGKFVVKGVLDAEDAARLKAAGVDGVIVSAHGGRQLDSAPPPILALKAIREALGADYPLFYDSGLRSGEDIVKAYAMGADYVFLGRPFLFAMAAGGAAGLERMVALLEKQVSVTLAQMGVASMGAVKGANSLAVNDREGI